AVTVPSGGDGQLVLVVEDESEVRELVCEMLGRLGYRTLAAPDAQRAYQLLGSRSDVALLLVDMVLPGGMSGAELVGALRRERPELPVLCMTGYSDDAVSNAREIQDVRLLPKPFSESALAAALREALHAVASAPRGPQ